ncbi:hypothetical protein ZOSMA_11G00910 [Zostera marina]|uniref:F-box domain-containing protein n=1 Tax=Zostera marina TaxID=29655 RepID=A0A0K9Q3M5_ZOSMR|nr:hypothetical protein ZOSMA_11G00910 [Zostera marina]
MEAIHYGFAKKLKVNEDRITSLPYNVKQMILDHLSLKESISTSFLSRDWRYIWRIRSKFFLDDETFSDIINAVNHVLSVHRGEIHTFFAIRNGNIFVAEEEEDDNLFVDITSGGINSWIDCLAKAHVQNLKLRFQTENPLIISSALFRCERLITLDLTYMELALPRSSIELRSLTNINFKFLKISSSDLERLIKSCPLLNNLNLYYILCENLNIHSPNLKYLKLFGYHSCLNLNETPMITDASISTTFYFNPLNSNDHCDFTNVLHNLIEVKALNLNSHAIEHLKLSIGIKFNNMEKLNVILSLERKKHIETIISILQCSPVLDCFHVQSWVKEIDYFQESEQFWNVFVDFKLNRLKNLSICKVRMVPQELRFIEFVLRNAPLLENFHTNLFHPSDTDDRFYKELIMPYPKASPRIKFCFKCSHMFQ